MPLLIEPYQSTYCAALSAMYEDLDAHSKTLGLPPTTTGQREQWLDHLTGAGLNLVALDDGNVVGHVAAVPAKEGESQLVVFVHQEYQNRGIGTELLKQLVAYADNKGVEAIKLTVALNNRRAITVYDNMGFDVIERMQGELAMRLSLDRPIVDEVKRPPAEQQ
ncbi:GNAT family N-acetyltransferase [Halorubrum trueperi]|uniref:GNAT family N-acetyltransferase n=1 Tax=Halorubrum trueperi TaxID=2004704 RepID=A0ABD5UGS2_9EURY